MKYKLQDIPLLSEIERIYFIGVKGAGVAPLALISKGAGILVRGSDIDEEFITDKYLNSSNLTIDKGFNESDISDFLNDGYKSQSLVITTGAHKGFDNVQAKWAKDNGYFILTQGQALGVFMNGEIFSRNFKGIAVAGSHGKTTISSLLATTLKGLGQDVTYSVGAGEVFPLGPPGFYGSSEYFVVEADEYCSEPVYDKVPKFLYLTPKYAIFNNIDFDHPDLYDSTDEIEQAFLEFADNIKSGGTLLVNGDDSRLINIKDKVLKDIKIVTYGTKESNDYVISKIVTMGLTSKFVVSKKGNEIGFFELSIPGVHNSKNALSVIALLNELGYEKEKIKICLREFLGTKRRMEKVGSTQNGALLIDDYGHHPLEISTTINALREAYPDKKLICVFQPHTFSRTKVLFKEFAKAFENADELVLLPIFKSQRDTENNKILSDEYLGEFSKFTKTTFLENFSDVVEYLGQNFDKNDTVILTIGAGDVYKIAYKLKK